MIYEFGCKSCGERHEFVCTVQEHEGLKSTKCTNCGGDLKQIFSTRRPFMRTAFPRNFVSEHVAKDPTKIRDESHFRDVAEQNDMIVTNPWDGI